MEGDDEVKSLKEEYDALVKTVKDRYEQKMKKITDTAEEIDSEVNDFMSKGEDWMKDHANTVNRKIKKQKEKLDAMTEEVERWMNAQLAAAEKKLAEKTKKIRERVEISIKQNEENAKKKAEEKMKRAQEIKLKKKVPAVPGAEIPEVEVREEEPDFSMYDE